MSTGTAEWEPEVVDMGRSLKTLAMVTGVSLVVAAVAKELAKPSGEREWHGTVAGVVPYDFRPPTVARARSTWWSPQDERVFVPQVFGVGWTLNIGRLARLIGLA